MTDETSDLILSQVHGDYAVVTLNRPDKRNAMNIPAQEALWDVLADLRVKGTKAIVLTGAGDVSFCAGADTRDKTPTRDRQTAVDHDSWMKTQDIIARHPAVIIAAVNGYALGGGLTLVNNADLAIASETATFGMPEIGLGIFPALAGPTTVRRILPKHAAEMIFTAERIDAQMALRFGLINRVVPASELLPAAEALAAHIAGFDSFAIDYSKKAYRDTADMSWEAGLDYGLRSAMVIANRRDKSKAAS